MKKAIIFLCAIFLTSGCSKKENIVCINTLNENNVKIDSEYTIIYSGKYVDKLKTIEKVTSDDQNELEKYKDLLMDYYNSFNKIDYYVNTVSIEGNTLISSTTINYEKIDINKLIEIDENNKKIISDKKVKLSTLKKLYIDQGATCK